MNCHHDASPRTLFDSTMAVRNENVSRTMATRRIADGHPGRLELVRVPDLLDALEDGERPAEAEQHQRHDEGPEVPLAAVAERVRLVGLPPGPVAAEQEQALVAGVGDRVDRLGQHRRRARDHEADELGDRRCPRLASSAATTALVPCPPPAMPARYGVAARRPIPARIGAHDLPRPGRRRSRRPGRRRPHPPPHARRAARPGPPARALDARRRRGAGRRARGDADRQPGRADRPPRRRAARRHVDHRHQLAPHRQRGRLHPRRQRLDDPLHRPGARGRGRAAAAAAADHDVSVVVAGPELDALAAHPDDAPFPLDGPGRRHDALHVGHHRPAQGREAPAPAEPAARRSALGGAAGLAARPRRQGPAPRHRAAVPRRPARVRGHRPGQRQRARRDAALGRVAVPAAHPGAGGAQQPRRAHDVRAPAAPAGGGAGRLRPVVAEHGAARRRADRAVHQAPDDRVVGAGAHRVLGEHRGRRVHAGRLDGVAHQAGHGRQGDPHLRGVRGRCRRRAAAGRRGRHALHPQPRHRRGVRVPPGRGEDRGRPPRARHLHDGRRRARRRGRLRVPLRPRRQHDHLGRREHLPGRDRAGAHRAPGRGRRRGVRDPRRGVGRAGEGGGGAARTATSRPRSSRPTCCCSRASGWPGSRCPASVDFEDELPRHPTGKLYTRLLRDKYWQDRAAI